MQIEILATFYQLSPICCTEPSLRVPAAQVQELSRLAETMGGIRRGHAVFLQELARRGAARILAATWVYYVYQYSPLPLTKHG